LPSNHAILQSAAPLQPVSGAEESADQALLRACRSVLAPLARLAMARGLRHAQLDELLRGAFVEAAREAHSQWPAQRSVSRVSAATGLNRREVARLMNTAAPEPARRSLATELFTRWLSDPSLRRKGVPLHALPRQGRKTSFETLARSVTKDVHPRTLLQEMSRLGLARHDEASDTVVLLRDSFVPTGDERRMLGFLGHNVGDHLSAAVDNVLADGTRHLEQAMFANALSADSVERLAPVVREQWQVLLRDLAPVVQQMIDADDLNGRARSRRLRVGMFAYSAPAVAPPAPVPEVPAASPATKVPRRRRKE
jgi:hypothetical protein